MSDGGEPGGGLGPPAGGFGGGLGPAIPLGAAASGGGPGGGLGPGGGRPPD